MCVVCCVPVVVEREAEVVGCLTEMLSYATGWLIEASDRGEVDVIVSRSGESEIGCAIRCSLSCRATCSCRIDWGAETERETLGSA